MLRVLRLLTAEELRKAAVHASAPPGAAPEEIIRALSRACGANLWGLFPASTDDLLLDFVGRRLGMPPLVGGSKGVPERERAIFCCYLRQAWHAADPARRRTILRAAIEAWDSSAFPAPLPPADNDEPAAEAALETLLQSSAGCRSLAIATETAAMPLPGPEPMFGPIPLRMGHAGSGHQALYAVLRVLWRARSRMLRERRAQAAQLHRQVAQVDSLLNVRRRNLSEGGGHWALNPLSGLSLTAAAGVSVAAHAALAAAAAPIVLVPAAVLGAAGLAWSASALVSRPKAGGGRTAQMSTQRHSLRNQLAEVNREVARLERE